MNIFDSLEMRWFLASDRPALAAVRSWFAATEAEGQRLDEYLLTGRGDLGFKVRGNGDAAKKLETKYLLGSLGVVTVAPGVRGKLERWRKLSLTVDDAELGARGTWIAVHKRRRLQQFAYDGKAATRIERGTRVEAGCSLELTELSYRFPGGPSGRTGYTLGLEAFGREELLLEALQSTVRVTFGGGLELGLAAEDSMSYPEWLDALA